MKNTQFLFHLKNNSDFYQIHWYPLLNFASASSPEPTPNPDVFNEEALQVLERGQVTINTENRDWLLARVEEARKRLQDKLTTWRGKIPGVQDEAEQQIQLQLDSLARLIKREIPGEKSLDEEKNKLIQEITRQLIDAVGGAKLKNSGATTRERSEGIQAARDLNVIPEKQKPIFEALQPLFGLIDDAGAGLDWTGADPLGASKTKTYLKDQLIQLFEKNPKFASLAKDNEERLKSLVRKWIEQQKEQNESWTDDRVDIHHANNLVQLIETYLIGLERQTTLATEVRDKDGEIRAQSTRADVAEARATEAEKSSADADALYEKNIGLQVEALEQRNQIFLDAFVKPYSDEENEYLQLDFSSIEAKVGALKEPVTLLEEGESDETAGSPTDKLAAIEGNLTAAKEAIIAILKEQLPKKFQEQKAARQPLIEKFGETRMGETTINQHLTAIETQFATLSDDVNEESLIATLSTLNASIIEVFTQLDALAVIPSAPVAPPPEEAPAAGPAAVQKPEVVQPAGAVPPGESTGGSTATIGTVGGGAVAESPPIERVEKPAPIIDRIQQAWSSAQPGNKLVDQKEEREVKPVTPHLNVRDDNGNKIGKLRSNAQVTVLPEALKQVGDNKFVKIRYDGSKEGWVAFEYLKEPEAQSQATAAPVSPEAENNDALKSAVESVLETQGLTEEQKENIRKKIAHITEAYSELGPLFQELAEPMRKLMEHHEVKTKLEELQKLITEEPDKIDEIKRRVEELQKIIKNIRATSGSNGHPEIQARRAENNAPEAQLQEATNNKPEVDEQFETFKKNFFGYFHFSAHYLENTKVSELLEKKYASEITVSKDMKGELDKLHKEVFEPLRSYKAQDETVLEALYKLYTQGVLSLTAFMEDRGGGGREGKVEKIWEASAGRIIKPVTRLGGAVFENILSHAIFESLKHLTHGEIRELKDSFLRKGLLQAGERIVNVPVGALFNAALFDGPGTDELVRMRKDGVKAYKDILKQEYKGVRRSDWERIYDAKISELSNLAHSDIFNRLKTDCKSIPQLNFDSSNVQDRTVQDLMEALATWNILKALEAQQKRLN